MKADIRGKERSVDQQPERDPQQDFVPPTDRDRKSRWGFRGMTVRDWLPILGALLIPVVIAAGTWVITWQQGKIEDRRAKAERELAEQRAQDEALQVYLDQMGTLLLERDLRSSTKDNATEDSQEARTLARARTLTVLSRLDPSRKTAVMQFLVEADLVQRVDGSDPIIILLGADLSEVIVFHQALFRFRADLSGANLRQADLRGAVLTLADLREANLREAKLREASLTDTDLSGADLTLANLKEARLVRSDLSEANLSRANLREASLRGADLSGAEGLSDEELLEKEAYSLEGATMPNGQKYEDWLKSREGEG